MGPFAGYDDTLPPLDEPFCQCKHSFLGLDSVSLTLKDGLGYSSMHNLQQLAKYNILSGHKRGLFMRRSQ